MSGLETSSDPSTFRLPGNLDGRRQPGRRRSTRERAHRHTRIQKFGDHGTPDSAGGSYHQDGCTRAGVTRAYCGGARSPLTMAGPLAKSTVQITVALPLWLIPGGLKFPLPKLSTT
jgi:hypothetical protein